MMSSRNARILEVRRLISGQGISEALENKIVKIKWYGDSCRRYFDDVDVFIEVSRGNTNVEEVHLDPYWYRNYVRRSDDNWEEKLGQALGTL